MVVCGWMTVDRKLGGMEVSKIGTDTVVNMLITVFGERAARV